VAVSLRIGKRLCTLVDAELNLGPLVVGSRAQACLGKQGSTNGIEVALEITSNTLNLLDAKIGDMIEILAETFFG